MSEQVAVGLMGGSFDPIHLGHILVAEQARAALSLQQVLFLPSGRPPHKAHLGASAAQRLEMTRLAVRELPWAQPCDIVVFREGTIYTVDTLELLHARMPSANFIYIIGADTLVDLPNWRNILKVCTLCDFVCVRRPGVGSDTVERALERMYSEYHKQVQLISASGPDISSTEVRARIAQGRSTAGLLPESVRSYIEKENLYRS